MKKYILNILFSGFLFLSSIDVIANAPCACNSAEKLCENYTFFQDNLPCSEGLLEKWFVIQIPNLISGQSIGIDNYNNGGILSHNFSYWLYGPYSNNITSACSSICNNSLNPIDSFILGSNSLNPQKVSLHPTQGGIYILKIKFGDCAFRLNIYPDSTVESSSFDFLCPEILECENCIGSFAPEPGKKYLISAWAYQSGASTTTTSYTKPQIYLDFNLSSGNLSTIGPIFPDANSRIIDQWQKIEREFLIPADATDINIRLQCASSGSGDCYFDDIRVYPYDGSMKSYVYDPITLKLVAELDERNYASFYEYDEDGKLIRVKKETERGIVTIKENRSNNKKR